MVNNFFSGEVPTKMLFHNDSMLPYKAFWVCIWMASIFNKEISTLSNNKRFLSSFSKTLSVAIGAFCPFSNHPARSSSNVFTTMIARDSKGFRIASSGRVNTFSATIPNFALSLFDFRWAKIKACIAESTD